MPEPKTAADRADLLMAWYEGHTVPSMALRDEIIVQLRAYAHQRVEAWKEQAIRACLNITPQFPETAIDRQQRIAVALRALPMEPAE